MKRIEPDRVEAVVAEAMRMLERDTDEFLEVEIEGNVSEYRSDHVMRIVTQVKQAHEGITLLYNKDETDGAACILSSDEESDSVVEILKMTGCNTSSDSDSEEELAHDEPSPLPKI